MRFSILLLLSFISADPVPESTITTVHGVTADVAECGCDTLVVDLWPKIFAKVDIMVRAGDIETNVFDLMQTEMEASITWIDEWIPEKCNDVNLKDTLIWFEIIEQYQLKWLMDNIVSVLVEEMLESTKGSALLETFFENSETVLDSITQDFTEYGEHLSAEMKILENLTPKYVDENIVNGKGQSMAKLIHQFLSSTLDYITSDNIQTSLSTYLKTYKPTVESAVTFISSSSGERFFINILEELGNLFQEGQNNAIYRTLFNPSVHSISDIKNEIENRNDMISWEDLKPNQDVIDAHDTFIAEYEDLGEELFSEESAIFLHFEDLENDQSFVAIFQAFESFNFVEIFDKTVEFVEGEWVETLLDEILEIANEFVDNLNEEEFKNAFAPLYIAVRDYYITEEKMDIFFALLDVNEGEHERKRRSAAGPSCEELKCSVVCKQPFANDRWDEAVGIEKCAGCMERFGFGLLFGVVGLRMMV